MSVKTLNDAFVGNHTLYATCRHAPCRFRREADIERLIMRLGGRTSLLASPGQVHFSDLMRCPSCKRLGMDLWLVYREAPAARVDNPNYRVLDWGLHPHASFDMVATADNLFVGRAAFIAAALFYPTHRIALQQGAFVIHDSKAEPVPEQMTPEQFEDMRQAEAGLATSSIKGDQVH